MFTVLKSDIDRILADFGIQSETANFTELQRYYYEKNDPASKEVRLIVKADLISGAAVVIRFKHENGVDQKLLENQCGFAALLSENGVSTPAQYRADGYFVKNYALNGYDVLVCAEEFVKGEIKCVDADIAEKTGALLARTHDIAEKYGAHVENDVLFDPFKPNDLFFFEEFEEICRSLSGEARDLSVKIIEKYREYMGVLAPLRDEARYAVQGDISDCNLYLTENGELGIFDFNRSGDNSLFCDAAMQAIFEARLMDYPESYAGNSEALVLPAFLKGYQSVRPFSSAQKAALPYLYAIVSAFWSMDIVWGDDSLKNECDKGNEAAVLDRLNAIWKRISEPQNYVAAL